MFFWFINNDVSVSPQICWEVESFVYGFIVDECYASTIKPFESFYEDVIRFADELSPKNKNVLDAIKNDIDWLSIFNNYVEFMEAKDNISPEHYFCVDKDNVFKFMKEIRNY